MNDAISNASPADFVDLLQFTEECEVAAKPHPPLNPRNLLASYAYITCFGDFKASRSPCIAINPDEELPPTRQERIIKLDHWMKQFPAHRWLNSNQAVKDAYKSFLNVKKMKKANQRYSNDLAEFGFWRCASFAAMSRTHTHIRSPDAKERATAASAATKILELIRSTSLLYDAGMTWRQDQSFLHGIKQLTQVSSIVRKSRSDAQTGDREFIQYLTQEFWSTFNDAPPTPIIHLSGLRSGMTTDQASITKMVKEEADRLRAARK
jgi:hypothetical protein